MPAEGNPLNAVNRGIYIVDLQGGLVHLGSAVL